MTSDPDSRFVVLMTDHRSVIAPLGSASPGGVTSRSRPIFGAGGTVRHWPGSSRVTIQAAVLATFGAYGHFARPSHGQP